MAKNILVALEKGKKKKAELTIVDDEIEMIRVYDRGRDALGFNGLYALLWAILKMKKPNWTETKLEAEVVLQMKWLNINVEGCHPVSLSNTDIKNTLYQLDAIDFGDDKFKKHRDDKLKQFKTANRDLKDEGNFYEIFDRYLTADGKLTGWLNKKGNEVGQCIGRSRTYPCKVSLAQTPGTPGTRFTIQIPDMVVRAYQKAVATDTRTVIDQETKVIYSLEDFGWMIMGFDCGFMQGGMNQIRLVEGGSQGEWVDIWIYPNQLPFDHRVNIPEDKHLFPVYMVISLTSEPQYRKIAGLGDRFVSRDFSATSGFNQLKPKRILYNGTGAQPKPESVQDHNDFDQALIDNGFDPQFNLQAGDLVCTQDVPKGWLFVGSAEGSGNKNQSILGPHLGNLPRSKFHHMMIVDSRSRVLDEGGPEIHQIGVTMLDRTALEKGYYMLIIDDSASVKGAKAKYINEAIKQIDKWMLEEEVVEKYIGIRLIRWKKDIAPTDWASKVSIGTSTNKKDYLAIKDVVYEAQAKTVGREEFTYRINIKSHNEGLPESIKIGEEFLDEKWLMVERWTGTGDGKVKIKMTKASRDNFVRNLLEKKLRMKVTEKSSQRTPLVECLDDLIDKDIKSIPIEEKKNNKFPVKVAILSDGQPDPLYQHSNKPTEKHKNIKKPYDKSNWLFRETMSYILATDPTGKSFDEIITESPTGSLMDNGSDKKYTLEGKLHEISRLTVIPKVRLISNTEIVVTGAKTEEFWINRIYHSPRMDKFVDVVAIDMDDDLTNQNTILDHSRLPHIDCNRGSNTTIRIGPCCEPGFDPC